MSIDQRNLRGSVFCAAAVALAFGALTQPGVAHAERVWDIQAYDTCMKGANDRYANDKTTKDEYTDERRFCCEMSGGQWDMFGNGGWGECGAPPATAQSAPQAPWDAGRAPRPETAAPRAQAPAQAPAEPGGGGTYQVVPHGSGPLWIP